MKNDTPPKLPLHITVKDFFRAFWKTILIWIIIGIIILLGLYFNIDKTIIGGV
jgi:uncharacterized membrane protein